MSAVIILALLIPLSAGFILLFMRPLSLGIQRGFHLFAMSVLVLYSGAMLLAAMHDVYIVYSLGDWMPPFGIVLVLDRFSALMVFITSFLALCALIYAVATSADKLGAHFHVLFQIQLFGLNGAFLTGDLFNMFVFFEVLLIASYGLLLHGGGRLRTKAGLHYVVINLVGSALFLFAVSSLYGVLGTLNIADLALKISQAPEENLGVIAASGLILLVVFGVKAAMFPLYLWLPSAYANTSAPIAALFAIMTKVGIYAIIRVHGTIFGSEAGELAYIFTPWLLWLGIITAILASFGVMAASSIRGQVAHLVLVSVGTMLIGFGIHTEESISATLYYMIHSTFVAGGFFLLADIIARSRGEYVDMTVSSPSFSHLALLGSLFLAFGIAIAGMPPLSGFFGKLLILHSAMGHSMAVVIFATLLISSFFVIVALAKSGSKIFYSVTLDNCVVGERLNKTALFASTILLGSSLLLVLFASFATGFSEDCATQLLDVNSYIKAVLR